MSKTLVLKLAGMSRNFTSDELDFLFEKTHNGIEINVKREDSGTPMPWDAGFEIVDVPSFKGPRREFQLTGGVAEHGFGYCEVRIPLEKVDDLYNIFTTVRDGKERAVYHLLRQAGIRFQEEGKVEENESEASLSYAYWNPMENDWQQEPGEGCYLELDEASQILKYQGERLTPSDDTEGSIGLQYSDSHKAWVITRATIVL